MSSDIKRYSIDQLGLLDGDKDSAFENLTELATVLLKAPVSLISIIDKPNDRQFFKSQQGLSEPWRSKGETPLTHSFCQHVVSQNKPLIVSNAPEDERVKSNLAIPDLGVRAYLGVPIHDTQGKAIGALCAIDGNSRKWNDKDLEILKKLALSVNDTIRLRSLILMGEEQKALQTEFTYAISHDIKGPIRSLKFLLNLISEEETGQLETQQHELLAKSLGVVERMELFANDLLSYALATQDIMDFQNLDLNDLVNGICEDLSFLIHQTNATVTFSDLPKIIGHESQLKSLFNNLILNGIKYNSPKRPPEIKITSRSTPFYHEIDISDNGIGISEEHHDQIFGLFKRLHPQSEYLGTGLGLAICSRVVSNMNGEIRVSSQLDRGSVFTIILPIMDKVS